MTRALVIGTGYGRAVIAPALALLRRFDDIAVVSGRSEPGVLDALLADDAFSLVAIAVPPFAQPDLVARARRHGRFVIVEKPGGLAQGQIPQGPGKVFVGYQFRFMRGLREWLAMLAAGRLGRLQRVEFDWRTGGWASPDRPFTWRCLADQGGGALRDLAVHELDLLRVLTIRPIRAVTSAQVGLRHATRRRSDGALQRVTAPDSLACDLDLDDGLAVSLRIEAALDQPVGHRITAHGEDGSLEWFHPAPFQPGTETLIRRTPEDVNEYALTLDSDESSDTRVAAFARLASAALDGVSGVADPAGADTVKADIVLIESALSTERETVRSLRERKYV